MNPQLLKLAILNAIARATADDWLTCSIGSLRNLIREVDTTAANATITTIADAMISLAQEGALLLGKREDGGKRLSFDFQRQLDEGYISNFFVRDSFDCKITHGGRNSVSTCRTMESCVRSMWIPNSGAGVLEWPLCRPLVLASSDSDFEMRFYGS